MKKTVDAFDYAGHICKAMKKGILLTTKSGDRIDTMTIGWGTLGIQWNRPIFIAYVRESRYTKELLEQTGEFSVNIPIGEVDSRIIRYCGTQSGRDTDKIRDLGLELVASDVVQVPGIRQLPLTLECKVIYSQQQELNRLPQTVIDRFYPAVGEEDFRDGHIAYYGEIVNAYLMED